MGTYHRYYTLCDPPDQQLFETFVEWYFVRDTAAYTHKTLVILAWETFRRANKLPPSNRRSLEIAVGHELKRRGFTHHARGCFLYSERAGRLRKVRGNVWLGFELMLETNDDYDMVRRDQFVLAGTRSIKMHGRLLEMSERRRESLNEEEWKCLRYFQHEAHRKVY